MSVGVVGSENREIREEVCWSGSSREIEPHDSGMSHGCSYAVGGCCARLDEMSVCLLFVTMSAGFFSLPFPLYQIFSTHTLKNKVICF